MDFICNATKPTDYGSEPNYDLNIFEAGEYYPELEGYWLAIAYKIQWCGCINSDQSNEVSRFEITPEEAKQLTLGVSEEAGGDYAQDSDFWLDSNHIPKTYTNIPARITDWLNSLPTYETPNYHKKEN